MVQDSAPVSLTEAHQMLKRFDCLKPGVSLASGEGDRLRTALLTVAQHSDYQILGVCADSITQAEIALKQYAAALGYTVQLSLPKFAGPAYLKFNPKSGLCYADAYPGEHRGVLVSCQSAYADGLNEMYGHLPLNLFAGE